MKRNLINQLMLMVLLASFYAFVNIFIHTSWLLRDFPAIQNNGIQYFESSPHVPFGYMDFQAMLEEEESFLMPSKAIPMNSEFSGEELERVKKSLPEGRGELRSAHEKATEQLKILMDAVTKPTYYCSKLLNQAGSTCNLVPTDDTKVCMDAGVRPNQNSCIVYSLGIGHNLFYDLCMAKYGCNVFSFDPDFQRSLYRTNNPYKRVYLASVRLGTQVEYRTVQDNNENATIRYFHRPLDNIMYILQHEMSNIDVLKIDIEGDEFLVLEESIFRTDILERTRQLSLEIHLLEFIEENPPEKIEEIAKNYTRIFLRLKSSGFELTYYGPKVMTPKPLIKVLGINFPLSSQQLWINRKVKQGEKPAYEKPILYYVKELDPEENI
ncbi:uncharacterized protein LOC135215099 [Macrobrachium nipponense]|uniref:uncharacterized protein LOC135215099 n=1 Tax=Macrobrachium nipponense TaxID=159736 RepID=UPI0030C81428